LKASGDQFINFFFFSTSGTNYFHYFQMPLSQAVDDAELFPGQIKFIKAGKIFCFAGRGNVKANPALPLCGPKNKRGRKLGEGGLF
jgi:hypothetical protein